MSKYLTPEEDLKYQLSTLSSYEPSDIDYPEFEVGYEDAYGCDGFANVCCIDVGDRALKRIVKLEEDNNHLTAQVEDFKSAIELSNKALNQVVVGLGYSDDYFSGSYASLIKDEIGKNNELLKRIEEENK